MTDHNSKKVLIIEDETLLLKGLADMLSYAGFTALLAKNGKEGLEIALKEHPGLIFLDVLMPIMGGVKMLEELRKDDWGKNVPVIVWTNSRNLETETKLKGLGGTTEYHVKIEFSFDDCVKKAKEILGE